MQTSTRTFSSSISEIGLAADALSDPESSEIEARDAVARVQSLTAAGGDTNVVAAAPSDSDQSFAAQRAWSMDEIAEYLRAGFWHDNYSTPHSFNVRSGGVLTCDLSDLSAAEQQVARMALSAWSQVTGIRFDTNSNAGWGADIRFVNDDPDGAYASSSSSYGTILSSVVNIPANWSGGPSAGFASYFYQTYIHEIGHALGLGHAGDYNGWADYGIDNLYLNDSWQASVMSYFSQAENTYINDSYAFVMTPMIADIIAIQKMYGTVGNINAGNTVWGEGANLSGAFELANRLMVQGQDITYTILDQGGVDWLKLGNDRSAQVIRLNDGTVSDVYGLRGNLSIAKGTIIENVIAGQNNDYINGNAVDNWLFGNGGRDTIQGGRGNDTLEGGAGADRLVGGLGDDLYIIDAGDTLIEAAGGGIDRIRASFNYTLGANFEALLLIQSFAKFGTGNTQNNTVVGNSQVNMLSGGAGNDTLFGMAGNDTLAGNAGADRLVGGAGNDTYIRDVYDTIVETANQGYDTVITRTDLVLGAHLESVVVEGNAVVKITGNTLDNLIIGNNAANVINGGGGNDVLTGGGGADMFVFSAGRSGRITDFENDEDTLRINAAGTNATAQDLLNSAQQRGAGVDLTLGGGTIRIEGITLAELRDDILVFA